MAAFDPEYLFDYKAKAESYPAAESPSELEPTPAGEPVSVCFLSDWEAVGSLCDSCNYGGVCGPRRYVSRVLISVRAYDYPTRWGNRLGFDLLCIDDVLLESH